MNTPQFQIPNRTFNTPQFGTITETINDNRTYNWRCVLYKCEQCQRQFNLPLSFRRIALLRGRIPTSEHLEYNVSTSAEEDPESGEEKHDEFEHASLL